MNFTLVRPNASQFTRYLAGIIVVSAGATLGIQSAMGAAPYDALLATITELTGMPFWASAWVLQAVWISSILALGGRIDIGTLLHSLTFGPIMSALLEVVPPAASPITSVMYLAGAVVGIALGLWLYLGAGFVAGMVDSMFEAVSARRRWSPTVVRTSFDVGCCAVAWLGTGPVGLGTVVIALGVGPLLGAFDSALLRPRSWRGIPLGNRPLGVELVDTSELPVLR